jgi:uncharacterized protein (TIGR00369 family)
VSTLLDRIRRFKADGDLAALSQAIPYSRFLGLSFEEVGGELRGRLHYADHLVGNPSLPALHGGTIGALLESTAIFHLLWRAETVLLPKTITITIDYLRPGRPVDTWACAHVTRQGRRVVNVRVEAWQEDRHRPVATANGLFLVLPEEP